MNHESLNRGNKHVTDVLRVKAQLETMSAEEVDILVLDKVQVISTRWALCRKSFRMLFMALNRANGHNMPADSFDIRVGHEMVGDMAFDTLVRVVRDRNTDTFMTRPFTRSGGIESFEYASERFGDSYDYKHGTYHSKSAKLSIDQDMPDPTIRLERIEGRLVTEMDATAKAILIAGILNVVDPSIEQTEETLILIADAAMDSELNPNHAEKFKLASVVKNSELQ